MGITSIDPCLVSNLYPTDTRLASFSCFESPGSTTFPPLHSRPINSSDFRSTCTCCCLAPPLGTLDFDPGLAALRNCDTTRHEHYISTIIHILFISRFPSAISYNFLAALASTHFPWGAALSVIPSLNFIAKIVSSITMGLVSILFFWCFFLILCLASSGLGPLATCISIGFPYGTSSVILLDHPY
jgi:hypothetical protein